MGHPKGSGGRTLQISRRARRLFAGSKNLNEGSPAGHQHLVMTSRIYFSPLALLFVSALGGCHVNATIQEARAPEAKERPGMARQVLRAEREQLDPSQD